MALCCRRRCRLLPVVFNIIVFCLLVELTVRLLTGHFLISLHLVQRVQRITTPWIAADDNEAAKKVVPHPNQQDQNRAIVTTHDNIQEEKGVKDFQDGFSSLEMALKVTGSPKQEVILIYTNHALLRFALNFVKVNKHLRNGVKFFLFVSDNASVCVRLREEHIPCWAYPERTKSDGQCVYHVGLSALQWNYTVQVIEYDVILIWNTLCTLAEKCPRKSCQAAASTKDNGKWYDGSILYVHPTPGSLAFMECLAQQYERIKLQGKIGTCSDKGWQKSRGYKVERLPEMEYTRGHFHLHENSRIKATCVNRNWDPTEAVYFMRESGVWLMEEEGYYGAASNSYLCYNNDWLKAFKDPSSVGKEKDALKNAFVLADILKRTLILPKFHCWWKGYDCLVTMVASPVAIAKLPYRESSFLENPRVDEKIKQDQSKRFIVDNTETYTDHLISLDIFGRKEQKSDDVVHLEAANMEHVTKEEVLEWFGGINNTVLRLVSTYGMNLCEADRNISKVCTIL